MHYKITNGAVSFGAETILENIDFEIRDKEKIAIVGRNGAGKSTLLKCITGEIPLEKGTGEGDFSVSVSGEPTIGYLKQIAFDDDSITMLDEVLKVFKNIFDIEKQMETLLEKIDKSPDEDDIKLYSKLCDSYDFAGGYTYKKEYSQMIKQFGFTKEDTEKKMSEFSGGQRTKIAFMKLLLSKPDVLLLDEPTNHLDISTVMWLENYLKSYKSAVVIVSHDRMFINKTVNKIYEIEYGETHCYCGNYSDFELKKRKDYEKRIKDHNIQQKEIAKIERLIERFRYKATKAKMVQSKIKMLERMKKAELPSRYDLRTFHADFNPEIQDVKLTFKAENLVVGYDKPLATVNLELLRGEKLAVIGNNGIGKSTFLKSIVGIIPPLDGNYSFGINSKIGYFDQSMAEISGEETVLQNFSNEFPALKESECRAALGAFVFSGDDVFKTLNVLSGGERVRLCLCKMLRRKPNFLILDEPTNHMDIVGKETLENMLKEYSGTLIFVSHDRYFVEKTADKLLVLTENGAQFFAGKYSEYEESKEKAEEHPLKQTKIKNTGAKKGYTTPLKEKQKLQKQIEKAERLINELTADLEGLNKKLSLPENISDYVKLSELENNINSVNKRLEEEMLMWQNLTEEYENISF